MNKTFVVVTFIACLLLIGCKTNGEEQAPEQPVNKETLKTVPCKNAMPPIRDKSKLKEMLQASGKITPEMSEATQEQIVNDYIKQKRAAFKRCKN